MCGINLLLNFRKDSSEQAIIAMMEATSHRGPDASSWTMVAPEVYVAANRLKIMGLEDTSNQPLFTPDKQQVLVWNGALYNVGELRNRLILRGTEMRGAADSEVLLHWLTVFGAEGLRDLQGMFSLIFIDLENERVVVARDLTGQKPLYFFKCEGAWIFSSEVRGILASGLVPTRLDRSQFAPYFYLRHPLPKHTFLEQIHQFPAGKVWVLGYDGREKMSFSLSLNAKDSRSPSVERFEEVLTDAVLTHMHAEVPVGVILSGGADSTLLYQLWYQETSIPLRSYTAVFEKRYDRVFEDHLYARQVAGGFRGKHQEVMVTPEVFLTHWEAYCRSLDQPLGDSAGFLTWMIAKEAQGDVKILVSGAGADELMGGYNRHRAFLAYLNHPHLANLLKGLHRFPLLSAGHRKFFAAISQEPSSTYRNLAALRPLPAELAVDLKDYLQGEVVGLKEALDYDRQIYLVEDVLKILDNSCMAFGIEGRSPYLDYPILALFTQLSEAEQRSLIGKKWIKDLLMAKGQVDVANRRKLGFGLPIVGWYHTHSAFRGSIIDTLSRFDADFGVYLPDEMRKLTQRPDLGMKRNYLQVWNVYLLASWIYSHRL